MTVNRQDSVTDSKLTCSISTDVMSSIFPRSFVTLDLRPRRLASIRWDSSILVAEFCHSTNDKYSGVYL